MIFKSCPNYKGGLIYAPLKLGNEWVITYLCLIWMFLSIHVFILMLDQLIPVPNTIQFLHTWQLNFTKALPRQHTSLTNVIDLTSNAQHSPLVECNAISVCSRATSWCQLIHQLLKYTTWCSVIPGTQHTVYTEISDFGKNDIFSSGCRTQKKRKVPS